MKIILAITGSIAAPKGLKLYQMLIDKNYDVTLLLSSSAHYFIKELPESAHYKVFEQDYYTKDDINTHIEYAKNADLFLAYPASQNFIAKIANGFANDLPSLVYSASNCYKMIFPAMNTNMYMSGANQRNINTLINNDRVEVLEPKTGMLACKVYGIGRAWEPEDVFNYVDDYFQIKSQVAGLNIMINYGRTRSYIDEIRFITNRSSGLMGDSIAQLLYHYQANLTEVVGDVDVTINRKHFKANTNAEMLKVMIENFDHQDIVICLGALNDFEPANIAKGKIKKRDNLNLKLDLMPSIDVLKELGKIKKSQYLVGFSAQDEWDLDYAQAKMQEKNLDMIVVNLISAMESNTNEFYVVTKNEFHHIAQNDKFNIAKNLINIIIEDRNKG